MPLSHPTLEWASLQDVFYRKQDVYELPWALDNLGEHLVAVAPNSGLVALVRDPARLVALGRAALLKPKIQIFTAAGVLLDAVPWDASNRIVALGFTAQERLAVVMEEGVVRLYTLLSPCPASAPSSSTDKDTPAPVEAGPTSYYVQYTLGSEAADTGVLDARIWSDGLVVLTGGNRFVEWSFPSREIEESSWSSSPVVSAPTLLPAAVISAPGPSTRPTNGSAAPASEAQIVGPPSTWAVRPPHMSASGLLEILVSPASDGGGTLLSIDSLSGCTDLRLTRGPFHALRPSPNGKLLALLTYDAKLWVVSADLQRSLSEFDVADADAFEENRGRGLGGTGVEAVEWCGDNSVVLSSESEVLMVGPFGDVLRFPYGGSVVLAPELDGVRIFSAERHEFLQKVPDASSAVFRPGSTEPAALLFDASECFAQRSAKADEGIRAIKPQLASAVDTCIEAAGHEWDPAWQRKLLRAASFGKAFIDSYDPTMFVNMARSLRVLNAARQADIGVPITFDEYERIGAAELIARLTARNHHLLCLRMSEHLNLRPDAILKHWARAKIARSRPPPGNISAQVSAQADDDICRAIVAKFESQPAVSYAEIARTAWNQGRTRLATKLLDYEPRAVDQVPLLLNMHEDKLALVKAIESGDTDLVYHVLLRLKSQLSRGEFFRIVQAPAIEATAASAREGAARPGSHIYLAANLLEVYARAEDRELLRDFYYQDDRRTESAVLSLEEASREVELTDRIAKIKQAQRLFAEDTDRGLEAKMTEEQVRLLGFQAALEKEEGGRPGTVGLSLNETIRQCFIKGNVKKAEKLRGDFKVPDKRYWSIRISALIATRDWEGLWTFAGSKKSPVGYTDFVSRLVAAGQTKEALRYVQKCASDKADRARLSALIHRLPPAQAQPLADKLEEVVG